MLTDDGSRRPVDRLKSSVSRHGSDFANHILCNRPSQEEQNDPNFSFIAPSAAE